MIKNQVIPFSNYSTSTLSDHISIIGFASKCVSLFALVPVPCIHSEAIEIGVYRNNLIIVLLS